GGTRQQGNRLRISSGQRGKGARRGCCGRAVCSAGRRRITNAQTCCAAGRDRISNAESPGSPGGFSRHPSDNNSRVVPMLATHLIRPARRRVSVRLSLFREWLCDEEVVI